MTECKYCDCVLPVGRHVALDSFKMVRMESTKQLDDRFVDILIVKCVGYDRNEDYLVMGKYYLETTDSDMHQGYTAINYCPMCNRKLSEC
ncbi:hypothetical protein [Latilactobacillus sakei]|uniref:hypothetical protein n=1 Tax=Latilactobacillus sakei TaxID=1599 RepID=UPI000C128CF3|nr:hypothetical protein [Latilactobacillus sakei]UNC17041.1 hypothetical protein FX990_02030 [Latilactobacillus sakei]SON68448.1 protein of unknown function [Latilactobacillus sakei]